MGSDCSGTVQSDLLQFAYRPNIGVDDAFIYPLHRVLTQLKANGSATLKGKSKSSHDLLKDDPSLSSAPALDKKKKKPGEEGDNDCDEEHSEADEKRERLMDLISQKLKKADKVVEVDQDDRGKKSSRSDELRKEARQLKKELQAIKQRKEESLKPATQEEEEKKPSSEAVAEYLEGRKKYEELRKKKLKKGSNREAQTMALLDRFKSKLLSAISEHPEGEPEEEDNGDDDDDDDKGWMAHVLQFDEQSRKVKDANLQDEDTFEIYDPRNPVNKRRREESKKILKEKKAKR